MPQYLANKKYLKNEIFQCFLESIKKLNQKMLLRGILKKFLSLKAPTLLKKNPIVGVFLRELRNFTEHF